jgi:hypothetical protein
MPDIDGTYDLLRAMFRQVEADATNPEPHRRADVHRWLREGELAWWDAFLGMDGALERTVRQRLAARLALAPQRETPQLAFRFAP